MYQSKLFYKTLREDPKDEEAINARLLVRAGFIDKVAAGIYNYLPLGYRVLEKIQNIIREEMDAVGGQEMLMPALHPKELWATTGRWDSLDVLFKLKGAGDKDFALGPTHEETVTPLATKVIFSYKDLPHSIYQIQTKFRNEPRSKSGLLRGREFVMKDLYSFHKNEKDLNEYYEKVALSYEKILDRIGIGEISVKTFASGGSFSKYSHEYQTICKTGEDLIYLCKKCNIAINHELIEGQSTCPECGSDKLTKEKAVEVGNIFPLKTKYADAFNLTYKAEDGTAKPVHMGCYGFGPSRAMGTIVEVLHDDKGIIWPESVAPFKYHLINLSKDAKVIAQAEDIYKRLMDKGEEVLYDDRVEASPGEKLAEADLIGIPTRLVVSDKTDGKVEVKLRAEDKVELKEIDQI
jgi:prolyl-tRNA synthetase